MTNIQNSTELVRISRKIPTQVFLDKSTAHMLDNFIYNNARKLKIKFTNKMFEELENEMIKDVLRYEKIEQMINPHLERWIVLTSEEKEDFLLKIKPYLRDKI